MSYAGERVSVAPVRDVAADINAESTALDSYQAKANIATGNVTITPVANTPTSSVVTGLSVSGSSFYCMAAASTTLPNTVLEVAYTSPSSSSVTLWVYRTNTTGTGIHYVLIGV